MTCLPNWTVLYPILYLESSFRTTHSGFRNEDAENESVPFLEVKEEAPDSNPDGQALEAEPDGLKLEDLHWVLVRVDLINWEIWLILVLMPACQDYERNFAKGSACLQEEAWKLHNKCEFSNFFLFQWPKMIISVLVTWMIVDCNLAIRVVLSF